MKTLSFPPWLVAVPVILIGVITLNCDDGANSTSSSPANAQVDHSQKTTNQKAKATPQKKVDWRAKTGTTANIITGKVVGVTDGDTITVLEAGVAQYKIRLEGIDAPESHQPFGTQSKKRLSDKVFSRAVRVEWTDIDRYRRILGHIYIDDRWINREMIEEGWAWHYKKYSDDDDLAKSEKSARDSKTGLWADKNPIAPWDFRHSPSLAEETTRTDPDTKQSVNRGTTVYVTKTGAKYHRAGCRYLRKSRIPIGLKDAHGQYVACSVCKPPVVKLTSSNTTSPRTAKFTPSPSESKQVTVYCTRTGSKYHRGGCQYLRKSKIPIDLESAKKLYGACSVCKPPR